MSDHTTVTLGLAFLVPIGFALIAASGLPIDRARQAAASFFAALGLAALGYVAVGFALQFGGIGLAYDRPGFEGLIWEWSLLGPTWGPGWGMAGLAGFGLTGAAATSAARALALANLPWVVTAAQIPVIALRGRAPAWAAGLLGLLVGALLYPLAGNWLWGGGWLANLGASQGFGHGLVDAGGASLVHLVGAAATLGGLTAFLLRRAKAADPQAPVPLPTAHLPVLALLGAGLLLAGAAAWLSANPLLDRATLDVPHMLLNVVLAAAGGALPPLAYTWFVAGRPDPLMAVRGLAAAFIAIMAAAPFVAPWAALLVGLSAGLLMPFVVFSVDHVLRLDDPTAALATHGLGAVLGLAALGFLADGTAGAGWNAIGASEYLGVARQGVTGLLAASGFRPDWPGQMFAQLAGGAAVALFSFFVTWLLLVPLAAIAHLLRPRAAAPVTPLAPAAPEEPALSPESAAPASD